MKPLTLLSTLVLVSVTGCASAPPPPAQIPATTLLEPGGGTVDVRQLVATGPLTVLVFFSRSCHCLSEHDARVRELYDAYHPRGVQLLMIDSEVRGSLDVDAAEAARRGYRFPVLLDRGAKLADALGAEYATYSVVVNEEGRVLYRGGFDSDRTHLTQGATPYLRNALDDLLGGKPPRVAQAKALGCALEKW